MGDYQLARTRSAAVVRSSSLGRSPSLLLSRTYSVPDLTGYVSASERYKPQWYSYYNRYQYTPYRYYRDYSIADDYWYDKYYYFSPLYSRSLFPRRYSYSDYTTNPYLWSSYGSRYWTRYKSYWFDYDRPSYYRRAYDPSYNHYLRSSYYPYRSYLLDSMTDSLVQGLHMFRKGVITYGQLNHNWLTPSWDKTFKNYRDLYLWDTEKNYGPYIPSYYNRKARSQSVSWVS
uniref:Uncharacterized protein n=1 Tax=Panagrolaimus superbus TaxID=310955 RepID=A0A914XXW7_9BILA